jgi:hypothetical protein
MKTKAVRLLEEMGVRYELRAYDVEPGDSGAPQFPGGLTAAAKDMHLI